MNEKMQSRIIPTNVTALETGDEKGRMSFIEKSISGEEDEDPVNDPEPTPFLFPFPFPDDDPEESRERASTTCVPFSRFRITNVEVTFAFALNTTGWRRDVR